MHLLRLIYGYICGWFPQVEIRRALAQAVVIALVAFGLGELLHHRAPSETAWGRATALAQRGDLALAERQYWDALQQAPTVPLLVEFLENHEHIRLMQVFDPDRTSVATTPPIAPIRDEDIEAFFESDKLGEETKLLARYYWGALRGALTDELKNEVRSAADREPPAPFANRLLARRALVDGDNKEAARRFEREGLSFAERREDAEQSLSIWLSDNEWDELGQRLRDPRFESIAPPYIRHAYALHTRNYVAAVKWLLLESAKPKLWPLLLALATGIMWFLFCARLGKLKERPVFRGTLLFTAFGLGVLSVTPTLLLIAIEEDLFQLRQAGDPVRDIVFFVAGVGLREELCKFLFFLPLVPFIRRMGTSLDALAAGAMVGLGFATEENLSYFAHADLSTVGRFVTANILHISMTGIIAGSFDDWLRSKREGSLDFSQSFLLVVLMHGAYDYFIASPSVRDFSFLSTFAFLVLARQFFHRVRMARGRTAAGDRFVERFVQAVMVVTGVTFIYLRQQTGPLVAASLLAMSLLGSALAIYILIREFRTV